jgi:hypothetical protein
LLLLETTEQPEKARPLTGFFHGGADRLRASATYSATATSSARRCTSN